MSLISQTGDCHCKIICGKSHATRKAETLLKRVARLENDVQAANDDSTAWMERFHEQCSKNHRQSLQIERAATSSGSKLTGSDFRDSEPVFQCSKVTKSRSKAD